MGPAPQKGEKSTLKINNINMMAQSEIHVYVASKARPAEIALWRALCATMRAHRGYGSVRGSDHRL
jgi:hypothetical protein